MSSFQKLLLELRGQMVASSLNYYTGLDNGLLLALCMFNQCMNISNSILPLLISYKLVLWHSRLE